MTTTENLPSPSAERPIGFGRLKRKEDARFIRGQGTYLDDIELPGMVHGAILRSPYAHARIVSIDTSAALAHPNVAAVVTAKDLETLGLAWMPTISYDTQAVLAGDKAGILDVPAVHERLDFFAEVRVGRPGQHQAQSQLACSLDCQQRAFAGNKSPEIEQVILRLFSKRELRRVHAVRNYDRGFQRRKRAPLMP